MEGTQLRWRWTMIAALLGFLPLTLLIPGASALQCHSYSSIQPVFGEGINSEFSEATAVYSTCSASQNACVEAHVLLSTEKTGLFVTHRGCANEGLKDKAESATSSNRHLTVHSSVLYCHNDHCNAQLTDLNVLKMPRKDKAPEASSSNQCYAGIMQNPDQDILDKVTCGKDYTQCYHGNGTITVGHLSMEFVIKTCQQPSCNVTESQSFGPIELKLWGSCCHGLFCNGKVAAPQEQNISKAAPTQKTTTPHKGDSITQTTDFTKHEIVNNTQNAFPEPTEVTVTPDDEWDIKIISRSTQNPLYDDEENEDDSTELPGATLNPRTWNLGPPKSSLQLYLLVIALGIVILGIW